MSSPLLSIPKAGASFFTIINSRVAFEIMGFNLVLLDEYTSTSIGCSFGPEN
jgi:hypothetical protein